MPKLSSLQINLKKMSLLTLVMGMIFQSSYIVAAPATDTPGNAVSNIVQSAGFVTKNPANLLHPIRSQKVIADEIGGMAEVQKKNTTEWHLIQEGQSVEAEDNLRTGENGRARLTFDGKTKIYLTPNTELSVTEISKRTGDIRTTLLHLKMGRLKAEVDKQKNESVFKVQTPTAIASVRGTILYMNVTQLAQNTATMLTDLYVDKGIVDFASLADTLNNLMVDAFGASSVSGDGTTLPLRHLSADQRNEFIQAFDEAFKNAGNPQTEVESTETSDGDESTQSTDSTDGLNDKSSEQDTKGRQGARNRRAILGLLLHAQLNQLSGIAGRLNQIDLANTAIAIAEGPSNSGDWDLVTLINRFEDGIVSADRLTSLDEINLLLADSLDEVLNLNSQVASLKSLFTQALASDENGGLIAPALQAVNLSDTSLKDVDVNERSVELQLSLIEGLRAKERNELRSRLTSILKNQTDLQDQAAIDRATDLQTGKVFTDAFGNRVRTDQYIFHEADSSTVQFLSLTLRTGEYQPGISSFFFETQFNRSIGSDDGLLRNLPWKDYLNVVTREEYAQKLGIDRYVDDGEGGVVQNPDYDALAGQFIVHESQSSLANGGSGLYPTMFAAEFANPTAGREGSDKLRFEETYADPYEVDFSEGDSESFFISVQSRAGELTRISPYDGEEIERAYREDSEIGRIETLKVGGVIIEEFFTPEERRRESQGADFSASDFSALAKKNGVNIFKDLDSDSLPANFYDRYLYNEGEDENWIDQVLIGIFLPIDNAGNVLDADTEDGSGFRLRGLRDLVNPNPEVNNGNYNLQTIFMYGHEDENGDFEETFRIDTIITPESFSVLDSQNSPLLFPHGIDTYDEDDGQLEE